MLTTSTLCLHLANSRRVESWVQVREVNLSEACLLAPSRQAFCHSLSDATPWCEVRKARTETTGESRGRGSSSSALRRLAPPPVDSPANTQLAPCLKLSDLIWNQCVRASAGVGQPKWQKLEETGIRTQHPLHPTPVWADGFQCQVQVKLGFCDLHASKLTQSSALQAVTLILPQSPPMSPASIAWSLALSTSAVFSIFLRRLHG